MWPIFTLPMWLLMTWWDLLRDFIQMFFSFFRFIFQIPILSFESHEKKIRIKQAASKSNEYEYLQNHLYACLSCLILSCAFIDLRNGALRIPDAMRSSCEIKETNGTKLCSRLLVWRQKELRCIIQQLIILRWTSLCSVRVCIHFCVMKWCANEFRIR